MARDPEIHISESTWLVASDVDIDMGRMHEYYDQLPMEGKPALGEAALVITGLVPDIDGVHVSRGMYRFQGFKTWQFGVSDLGPKISKPTVFLHLGAMVAIENGRGIIPADEIDLHPIANQTARHEFVHHAQSGPDMDLPLTRRAFISIYRSKYRANNASMRIRRRLSFGAVSEYGNELPDALREELDDDQAAYLEGDREAEAHAYEDVPVDFLFLGAPPQEVDTTALALYSPGYGQELSWKARRQSIPLIEAGRSIRQASMR